MPVLSDSLPVREDFDGRARHLLVSTQVNDNGLQIRT